MNISDEKVFVQKLKTTEDWPHWKWQVNDLLRGQKLESLVNGTRPLPSLGSADEISDWNAKDAKALSII